jgi:hypothetical protein
MAIRLIPEILDEVKECTTEEQVKTVLLKNQSPALRLMFQYVFRPESVFTIKTLPEYTPDSGPLGLSPSSLFMELKRFYVLLDIKDIPERKKREILVQMLVSVHPTEAVLIGKIINHDLEIPLLTKKVVQELWPTLF